MTIDEAKKILLATKFSPKVREALGVLLPDLHFQEIPPENLPNEIWRDISGYKGKYQVSNFARVKSFHKGKVRILKPEMTKGYLRISLYKNGKTKLYFVHILVARAFIPNPDKKPFVNHVDGNKLNNNASNLEWVTASENQQHAIKLGLQKTGCERHNAKLLLEQIRDIRTNCVPGDPKLSFTAFAKKFNVNISTVSDAYHRITYKNVE